MVEIAGPVILFGIILLPLYLVLAGWYIGEPRQPKHATMGVFFLFGFIIVGAIVGLWALGLALSIIMGL